MEERGILLWHWPTNLIGIKQHLIRPHNQQDLCVRRQKNSLYYVYGKWESLLNHFLHNFNTQVVLHWTVLNVCATISAGHIAKTASVSKDAKRSRETQSETTGCPPIRNVCKFTPPKGFLLFCHLICMTKKTLIFWGWLMLVPAEKAFGDKAEHHPQISADPGGTGWGS